MTAPGWACDGPGRWNDNIYKLSQYRRLLKKNGHNRLLIYQKL